MTSSTRRFPSLRVAYWDRRKARNAFTALWLHARSWYRGRRQPPATAPGLSVPYRRLFVVGCPRSGTTWITSILAAHPQVISTAESHAYATVLGPFLGRRLRGDAGWRRVLTRYDLMAARPWNVGLHRYVDRRTLCDLIVDARSHRGWSDVEAAEHVIARAFDHFFTSHGGTPDHLFVEKTPDHLFHAHRILRSFPDARVVEVVRDGRDVCASMQRLVEREWWPPSDRPAQIETWLKHIERGAALRADAAFVDRVLQVRYEAVRAHPSREISTLFAFAGLDASPEQVARIVAATDIAHGPPATAGHPEHRGRVGGWRDHFTAEDAALFRHLAGEACRQLGYEL